MNTDQHITAVEREGKRLGESAREAGLDTLVPACPGWDVRELLRHTGLIHLWAASHVAHPHEQPRLENEAAQRAFTAEFWPELAMFWVDDGDLADWYLQTNANLVDVLRSAPDDLEAWTFLPAPSPRAMWARRQAHETAIHRYDAESAADDRFGFDAEFASDGVDEILRGMTTQRRLDVPVDEPQSMLVNASDTDDQWLVRMDADLVTVSYEDGPADGMVSAPASDLYLSLWNRMGDANLQVSGDRRPLDTWKTHFRARWYQNG